MCGIFGIITPQPRKLDKRAFCVLGVDNDSRGGDSCGVFIDKRYEYGVNENKLFYSFFPRSKVLSATKKAQIALGHCRKASVGAVNEANAQPVVIKNDRGEVEFALIHNGTIVNYLELAKKYIPQIDVKNMTDSQVMAHIFYHEGFKVLGEYIGAGAFVMVDYRDNKPKVFIFKGESKQSKYSSSVQVERPLFCSFSSTEFVFSSIMDYLKALRPGREVFSVPTNKLLMLSEGKIFTIQEYDRKELWQQSYSYTYSSSTSKSSVCNSGYSRRGSEDYDDTSSIFGHNWGNRYFDDVIEMNTDGTYYIGSNRAHGIYWVDPIGNIEERQSVGTFQVAFWKGVILKNPGCFCYLTKYCKDLNCSHEDLIIMFPDLIHYLSPVPCWKNSRGYWVTSDTPDTQFRYTGTAVFPFTTQEVYFSHGKVDSYVEGVPYSRALEDLIASKNYLIGKDAV